MLLDLLLHTIVSFRTWGFLIYFKSKNVPYLHLKSPSTTIRSLTISILEIPVFLFFLKVILETLDIDSGSRLIFWGFVIWVWKRYKNINYCRQEVQWNACSRIDWSEGKFVVTFFVTISKAIATQPIRHFWGEKIKTHQVRKMNMHLRGFWVTPFWANINKYCIHEKCFLFCAMTTPKRGYKLLHWRMVIHGFVVIYSIQISKSK